MGISPIQSHLFIFYYACLTAFSGTYFISIASEGWFRGEVGYFARALLFGGGVLILVPGLSTDSIGLSLVFTAWLAEKLSRRKRPESGKKAGEAFPPA